MGEEPPGRPVSDPSYLFRWRGPARDRLRKKVGFPAGDMTLTKAR